MGRSDYILGKIQLISLIPINLKKFFGNATMVDVCSQWFLVHFMPILSNKIYNNVS